jgi:hypothetical protein
MAFCGKCGSPLAEGQTFCGSCGQQTAQEAAPQAAASAPPPGYAPPPAYTPPPPPPADTPPPSSPGYAPPPPPPPPSYTAPPAQTPPPGYVPPLPYVPNAHPVDLHIERPETSSRMWALFTVIIPIKFITLFVQLIVLYCYQIGVAVLFFLSQWAGSSPAGSHEDGTRSWSE